MCLWGIDFAQQKSGLWASLFRRNVPEKWIELDPSRLHTKPRQNTLGLKNFPQGGLVKCLGTIHKRRFPLRGREGGTKNAQKGDFTSRFRETRGGRRLLWMVPYVQEGKNERGRVATSTSFSIFDSYDMKSLWFISLVMVSSLASNANTLKLGCPFFSHFMTWN